MRAVRLYYSTFIPGLLEPVEEALRGAMRDTTITLSLDGLVVYESGENPEVIRTLPFVTNTFSIIKSFAGNEARSVEVMADGLLKDRALRFDVPLNFHCRATFRIIPSVANRLVPLDNAILRSLEQRTEQETGLRPNRTRPDFEFWLAQRSEGYGFFSLRLSRHRAYDKALRRGELRPELANILCRLSEPAASELFLDPFCGSGAIPLQRALHFEPCLVIASDRDEQQVRLLKQRVKELGLQKRIVVRREDGLRQSRYEDRSIHKIVTDPPWGEFTETDLPVEEFYRALLGECWRLLRSDGRLVILTGAAATMDAILGPGGRFAVARRFNILVSGRKASVYVLAPRRN